MAVIWPSDGAPFAMSFGRTSNASVHVPPFATIAQSLNFDGVDAERKRQAAG